MKCPNCGEEGTLDWVLTFCEFKCDSCGEKFAIHDLVEAGEI